MESLSVVGASPCVSSSLYSKTSSLSCAPSCRLILNPIKKHRSLAAFHLFTSTQSRPHASKKNHRARIFLPHLVASMVCFLSLLIRTVYELCILVETFAYPIVFWGQLLVSGTSGGDIHYD